MKQITSFLSRRATLPISEPLLARWSPRALTGEALPCHELLRMLEAARWSPSASNNQPARWVYALAGEPAFDAIHAALVPANQGWTAKASALLALFSAPFTLRDDGSRRPNPWSAFDAGAAWMGLALQAHAQGWVAHAMGGFEAAALKAAVQAPPWATPHAVVAIGRHDASDTAQPNQRKPSAQVASDGRWRFSA